MEDKKFDSMAFLLYESDMARYERINKRLWILCIVLGLGNLANLILWILM